VVLGVVVGITYHAYYYAADSGKVSVVEEAASPAAEYGHAGNLRTVTVAYPRSDGDASSDRTAASSIPDGRLDSYAMNSACTPRTALREITTFAPTNAAGATGDFVRVTLVHGTVTSPNGVVNKTTKEVTITDRLGRALFTETYVMTASGYARIGWSANELDDLGHVVKVTRSNGMIEEATWAVAARSGTRMAAGWSTPTRMTRWSGTI